MPNFLVIGAAKAGTTALYHYFRQHPDIYLSAVKEPRFFAHEGRRPDYRGPDGERQNSRTVYMSAAYEALFADAASQTARGEMSTDYLSDVEAPARIRRHIPHAKLLAILRDPVDRAHSHFKMMVRERHERLTFAEALAAEAQRIEDHWSPNWHHQRRGFYYLQLKRYYDLFPRGQIFVYLYEDFVANPVASLREMFRFLEVDVTVMPDVSNRYNESIIPKNHALQRFLTQPRIAKEVLKPLLPRGMRERIGSAFRRANRVKMSLAPDVRRHLVEVFRDDIVRLQGLIEKDLSRWLR